MGEILINPQYSSHLIPFLHHLCIAILQNKLKHHRRDVNTLVETDMVERLIINQFNACFNWQCYQTERIPCQYLFSESALFASEITVNNLHHAKLLATNMTCMDVCLTWLVWMYDLYGCMFVCILSLEQRLLIVNQHAQNDVSKKQVLLM